MRLFIMVTFVLIGLGAQAAVHKDSSFDHADQVVTHVDGMLTDQQLDSMAANSCQQDWECSSNQKCFDGQCTKKIGLKASPKPKSNSQKL